MAKMKDLTGYRSGRLVAIKPTENRSDDGCVKWLCRCDCGNEVEVATGRLTRKNNPTLSCGCLQKERSAESAAERAKDLTGQRFERLVAIRPTVNRSGGNVKWLCRCDCGNEVEVAANNLVRENTRSCGCLQKEEAAERAAEKAKDLTGQRFERLLAIRPTDNRSGSSVIWLCHCDCGNEVEVSANNLVSENTRSCGCLQKEEAAERAAEKAKDLTGYRFGRLVAIRPTKNRSSSGRVMWLCHCDCGNEVEVDESSLVREDTRSCGCLQKELAFVPTLGTISPGYRSGKLEAISPTNLYSGYYRKWECRCDCGKMTLVSEYRLIRQSTQSCGCINTKDLTGYRSGRLVAIRPTKNRSCGCIKWLCHCDCGNEIEVSANNLTRENNPTRSCGCLSKETSAERANREASEQP